MRFFSVARQGGYVEGRSIDLDPNADDLGNEVVAHLNTMYPAGFSFHGVRFFRDPWQNRTPADFQSGTLELLLEATRKAYFPSKPSRYQSVFACDTVESAKAFKAQYGKLTDHIYELHPQAEVHRGDMSLYALKDSFACIDHRIHLYWKGETLKLPEHRPTWEYVAALPVLVGERVA